MKNNQWKEVEVLTREELEIGQRRKNKPVLSEEELEQAIKDLMK